MSNTLALLVFLAALSGTESVYVRRHIQCSFEGTLRPFAFTQGRNTPLFCECKPGFEGRYCETRVCVHGEVRVLEFDEHTRPGNYGMITSTACICDAGFTGPTCEEKLKKTRKPVPWSAVFGLLEPIVFVLIFLIPCSLAFHMARDFVQPAFWRSTRTRSEADQYSPIYYDAPPIIKEVYKCAGNCGDSAPPAYGNITSNPMDTVSSPVLNADLRQPIYTEKKVFNHV
ncbi:hypothetical protein PFISCL1PPCAC_17377 [Pristionchus fissidentatus]|uniref:EGF-like domain-containing protein n=1 Tax=Pristionchus fissidentatus TaxID=1538716 RepID=A0AAV5W5Z8_9BILA|nr:hypothetical protein PFISCL1PPCAC_17377 [Pristionchus fissidentatus]